MKRDPIEALAVDILAADDEAENAGEGMSDSEIATKIDELSAECSGVDDTVQDDRATAYEYYHGKAVGDLAAPDIPGRSRVVSRDLMEVVEWAMPALMEMFTSTDDVVKFEPDGPEDEQGTADATNYIGYLINRKNEDGFTTLHDAIKSALICGTGAGKTYCEHHQDHREEKYYGLSAEDVELLKSDPEIEIIEEVEEAAAAPALYAGPQSVGPDAGGPTFYVRAKLSETVVQFVNVGIPPEELRVHKDSRSIVKPRFIAHEREVTLSYLREQGFDSEKIDQLATDERTPAHSDAEQARNPKGNDLKGNAPDESQRTVILSEAYLTLDVDGDGKTEYYKVIKADKVIFSKEVTDDHPFWYLTPILMPYQLNGLSFYDLLKDLQETLTALKRAILDNAYLANNPRTEVAIKEIYDMDEILSPRVGGMVQVKNLGAMREIQTPDRLQQGLALVQYQNQQRDTRSGITEMNSAMNGEALSQTNVGSQGVQQMMQQGAQRIKLVARVLAETGIRRMYYLMLKNVTQYQDREQQIKINGRWLRIDPREWKNKYNMTVSIGTGTFGKQEMVVNLRLMGQMLKDLVPLGIAGKKSFYQIAKRVIEAMGFRDVDQFIREPQDDVIPQQGEGQQGGAPGSDPLMAKAVIDAEMIKAKASADAHAADNASKERIAREKIQSEERVAMFKAQQEINVMRLQAGLNVMEFHATPAPPPAPSFGPPTAPRPA